MLAKHVNNVNILSFLYSWPRNWVSIVLGRLSSACRSSWHLIQMSGVTSIGICRRFNDMYDLGAFGAARMTVAFSPRSRMKTSSPWTMGALIVMDVVGQVEVPFLANFMFEFFDCRLVSLFIPHFWNHGSLEGDCGTLERIFRPINFSAGVRPSISGVEDKLNAKMRTLCKILTNFYSFTQKL